MVEHIAASEQNPIKELLCVEELGDRKPSQLLRRMQQLLGEKLSKIDDSFVRQLFLQRLFTNVQMVLASMKDSPCSILRKRPTTLWKSLYQVFITLAPLPMLRLKSKNFVTK